MRDSRRVDEAHALEVDRLAVEVVEEADAFSEDDWDEVEVELVEQARRIGLD